MARPVHQFRQRGVERSNADAAGLTTSAEELDLSGGNVVHSGHDNDLVFRSHFPKNVAAVQDHFRRKLRVGISNGLNELLVLGASLASDWCRGDCRLNFFEHLREIAELCLINGSLHGSAFGVPENNDRFCAGYFAGELQAADDVQVREITSDACRKKYRQSSGRTPFLEERGCRCTLRPLRSGTGLKPCPSPAGEDRS